MLSLLCCSGCSGNRSGLALWGSLSFAVQAVKLQKRGEEPNAQANHILLLLIAQV